MIYEKLIVPVIAAAISKHVVFPLTSAKAAVAKQMEK